MVSQKIAIAPGGLPTPPLTCRGALVKKKLHLFSRSQILLRFSRSHISPIGVPLQYDSQCPSRMASQRSRLTTALAATRASTIPFALLKGKRSVYLSGPEGCQAIKLTWRPRLKSNGIPSDSREMVVIKPAHSSFIVLQSYGNGVLLGTFLPLFRRGVIMPTHVARTDNEDIAGPDGGSLIA